MDARLERLVAAGVHEAAGISADHLRTLCPTDVAPGAGVLVVHPQLLSPSRLTTLLRRDGKAGFVVVDMTDLDSFEPVDGIQVPDQPLYWIHGVDRGDLMANWSPDEALPTMGESGRSPLTISEGISWLLQDPAALAPGHGFMCIGSRKVKASGGLDPRTPALWISSGTGRDGRARAGAPKTGWCWAGNRHTWLGFASTAGRL